MASGDLFTFMTPTGLQALSITMGQHNYRPTFSNYMGVHSVTRGRRGSRIQKGGFVQEFRLENRSYPDVHDFSLRMKVIIAND